MKYYVKYMLTGSYTTEVEAGSPEEAKELAEEAYCNADFGELKDIGEYGTKVKIKSTIFSK